MACERHVQDHASAEQPVYDGCQRPTDFIHHYRRQGYADDHRDQLKSLPKCVGFCAGGVTGKYLRKERAVVGIDHRIERAGQDVEEHGVDIEGVAS